jgi:hypothetical protein
MGIDDAAVYTAELDGLIAAAERRPAEPPGRGRASARHAAASASHASVWDGAQLALGLDDEQERRSRLLLLNRTSRLRQLDRGAIRYRVGRRLSGKWWCRPVWRGAFAVWAQGSSGWIVSRCF